MAYTLDNGFTWQTETTGINLIANEPYQVVTSPNRNCYLFSPLSGEIRKRLTITTGIPTASGQSSFRVYPNPFKNVTTISFAEQQKNTILIITDLSGKKVQSLNFTGIELTIDRNELTSGIYFLTITDNHHKTEVKKLVIE